MNVQPHTAFTLNRPFPRSTGAGKSDRCQRGFTLVELLVVVVIIGVIVSVASLSVGVLGRDNQIEDQARRLYAVITQVREESELQGRDVGLLVERDGYLFMRYDYATQHWQVLNNDELTHYRELPEGLQFRLWLEGREVILKSHAQNQELLARSSSSSSSASSTSSAANAVIVKDEVMPQVAMLSSGELAPFELRLARDGTEFSWRLVGGADNILNIDSGQQLSVKQSLAAINIHRGFTLIEVLAALVIVSLGMLAVIQAVGQTVSNATYLREKSIAHWVAMNKLTEVRLNNSAPANEESNGDVEMANTTWHWRMRVTATDAATLQRIDINVAPKAAGEDASIASLSGFYGTAISTSGNRVEWDPNPSAAGMGGAGGAGMGAGSNSSSSSSSSES